VNDPMTGYEQAESEAAERHYETRYENDWAEAVEAATTAFRVYRWLPQDAVLMVLSHQPFQTNELRVLQHFHGSHGTPALLRVIAQALELSK